MDDLTLGIIYAIKQSDKSARESIIDFLAEYTATPKQYYSNNELVRIIRDSFVDYLKTADKPAFDVWQYFDAKRQQENFKEVFPEQQKKYAERDGKMDCQQEIMNKHELLMIMRLRNLFSLSSHTGWYKIIYNEEGIINGY